MRNTRVDPLAAFLQRHPGAMPWLLCCAIGVEYCFLSLRLSGNIFAPTHSDYYNYLLDALVHGRVNVTPPFTYDLSWYQGKWYLYWGPAPILLVLPFYVLWGTNASDVIYVLLGGAANVVLIYLCMRETKRYFNITFSPVSDMLLLSSFAFASPNFLLSLVGAIWASSQIFAITFLLLFYFFFFSYLNSGKQYYIAVSVVSFCLACLSRYSLLFHGLLLIYLFWDSRMTGRKISRRLIITIGGIVLSFVFLDAFYNYLRFQNILEIGQRFQQGSIRYNSILKNGAILSFGYFSHNIYYYFLNPVHLHIGKYPLQIDPEGNSVLMVYPSLLLCPLVFFKYRQFDHKKRCLVLIVGIAALFTMTCLLLYFATGWMQFGNRYFFDAFPLFFLLLVMVTPYIPEKVQWIVAIWGIGINFLGMSAFFSVR